MLKKNRIKLSILLPPAVGYSIRLHQPLLMKYKPSGRYVFRFAVTFLINLINWPFRTYERLFINPTYDRKDISKPPVFIIGHWRSGTTYLHNLMCQDPDMAYVTTYHSVFPDTLFNSSGRILFKNFMRLFIPRKRKGDNVQLSADFPQEDEFTLGAYSSICFYHFWMFPREMMRFYEQFVRFQGQDALVVSNWEKEYKRLINKAVRNKGGEQFVSKNPVNTARIKQLLKAFPKAKFIHIHRNPVEVYLSTLHFFNSMMPRLRLQSITATDLEKQTIDLYTKLMGDFLEQRQLIPTGQLVEIGFEDLQASPVKKIHSIYQNLGLSGFEDMLPQLENYLQSLKGYKKNEHQISPSKLEELKKAFKPYMQAFEYSIPDTIKIMDE